MNQLSRCKLLVNFVIPVLWLTTIATPWAAAQTEGQRTFRSSKEAVESLIKAAQEADLAALQAMLGPHAKQIISSGDEVSDRNTRELFVAEYKAKHSLVNAGEHLTLNIGANDWPFPIPLVRIDNRWYWDGDAGLNELLYRRIGRNELAAIGVCHGIVAAQREYAAGGHDGRPVGAYASRIVSEPGKRNGLYWEVANDETPSPAGPLLAQATAEGYDASGSKRIPYHGYYYRMLKNPAGFGFLAYPAEYFSSGVMSFIVDQSGIIYEKDLGDETVEIAEEITEYKRDDGWMRVDDSPRSKVVAKD